MDRRTFLTTAAAASVAPSIALPDVANISERWCATWVAGEHSHGNMSGSCARVYEVMERMSKSFPDDFQLIEISPVRIATAYFKSNAMKAPK